MGDTWGPSTPPGYYPLQGQIWGGPSGWIANGKNFYGMPIGWQYFYTGNMISADYVGGTWGGDQTWNEAEGWHYTPPPGGGW